MSNAEPDDEWMISDEELEDMDSESAEVANSEEEISDFTRAFGWGILGFITAPIYQFLALHTPIGPPLDGLVDLYLGVGLIFVVAYGFYKFVRHVL